MRNFLEAFFRRKTAILLIALISIGIIILGTYSRTPSYMSETRFMIPLGRELGASSSNVQSQATLLMMNYADQIATQMEVLKNRRLVEDAIARMPPELLSQKVPSPPIVGILKSLRNKLSGGNLAGEESASGTSTSGSFSQSIREWLLQYGIIHELTDREGLVIACSSRLKVERQNDSGVMHLKFTHPSPTFARMFLVKYLEAYEQLRASSGTAGSDMPFYADQETHLRDSLREASDRLAEFRKQWGLRDIKAQRDQYTAELVRLEQIINESRTQETQSALFLKELQTEAGRREPESIFSSVMRDDPAMVHNLRSIAALLARESRLRAEVGRNHPELLLIQRETQELREGLHRSAVSTLHTQAMNARLQLSEATRQRDEAEDRMAILEAKTVEMRALESEVEVASDALLSYGRNRESARVTSQMDDKRINSVMVIEPPTRPYTPGSPKPFRDIALGVVFSVFLGLYYAYFMETFSDNTYTIDSVIDRFPDTAVVAIPELKKRSGSGDLPVPENAMAMLGRKFFYRDKRLSIPKSVLVVGSTPKAGATTVAKMLAQYMARTYATRILLVDARLPAQQARKNVTNSIEEDNATTLSDWLLDRSKRPQPCEAGEFRMLEPGGGGPEVRSAMLRIAAEDLTALGDFDTILFDASPLSTDSITFHLAALTEATIPVVRMEHTRKGVLRSMNDDLTMSGATVRGVVCNRRRFYIPQWIYKRLS